MKIFFRCVFLLFNNCMLIYEQLSRISGITHKNAFHQTIDSFAYTHDPVGNRLTQTIKENIPHTMNYTYDKVYRLAKASPFSRNKLEKLFDDIVHHHTEAYSYDPVGNRQTGPDKFDSYTYNDGNELLTSTEHPHQKTQNEYDANGNLIKKMETVGKWKTITSYAYDDENRLIDVTIRKGDKIKAVSFAYDPFGRRISKTTEREELDDDNNIIGQLLNKPDYPRTTFYIYDQQNIITEYDGNGKQTAFYIHGPNIDEPLAAEINNTRIYYHADGLGSITTLTNHMGHKVQEYDYDSFGNIKSTPFWIKQPFTYTGREYDSETNLYYYRARYYDSNAGRFITRDPIGFGGGINQYLYARQNPVNFSDPYGLTWGYSLGMFTDWVPGVGPVPRIDPNISGIGIGNPINYNDYGGFYETLFGQHLFEGADGWPWYGGWPFNGSPLPGYSEQDNICTRPAGRLNNNPCTKKCCIAHDNCYKRYGCNMLSWRFGFGACEKCNVDAVHCVAENIGKSDCECATGGAGRGW
ncbi:MAG TPA: RHS repeat-associated core domain-containing protein [Smithella sp.]|nr:RHS repeat-associated core domain-containing protein [Smithella sp.]